MSKYTTELRYICEQYCLSHYPDQFNEDNIGEFSPYDIAQIVARDGYLTKYGDSDFNIYDEDYRIPLMVKFIMAYYTREIGEETFGLWKLRVRSKFDLIMPYYNELYKSALFEFNPLYTEDITTTNAGTRQVADTTNGTSTDTTQHSKTGNDTNTKTGVETATGNGTATGTNSGNNSRNTNSSHWNLYSDTPQGGIYGIEHAENPLPDPNLSNNGYLTNATHDIENTSENGSNYGSNSESKNYSDTTNTSESGSVNRSESGSVQTNRTNSETGNSTTTDQYVTRISGYRGYPAIKLIREFRDNILNIDNDIINEFKKMFILLW